MANYEHGDNVPLIYWGDEEARPYTIPADAVAVMVGADGAVEDVALNWETAESMILEGFIAVPIGHENRERYGKTFAYLRECWLDCWT